MNEAQEPSMREEIIAQRQGNSFELIGSKGKVGEITFLMVDTNTWMIDHTYVDPDYRGQKLAKRLLDLVVNEARAKGRKIIPSCSYALAEFRRHENEYKDVWVKGGGYADRYGSDGVTP